MQLSLHKLLLFRLVMLLSVLTVENRGSAQQKNMAPPVNTIRSITFYDSATNPGTGAAFLQQLDAALPAMRKTGFNTVWLVCPWVTFNPQPLAQPPIYDAQAFAHLKQVLDLLRRNHMRAILGLNYLGKGWAPQGIDAGHWIRDKAMYGSFEAYTQKFLSEIKDYHDMVYILFFTENSEPTGMADQAHAREVAALLRASLGSLPQRLPSQLRRLFCIGYHDYSLINLGWAQGESPIEAPNSFDFLSLVAYGLEDKSGSAIAAELDTRAARFKALYPTMPLLIGESGASSCNGHEANQARVLGAIAEYAVQHSYGINVWSWKPGPPDQECTNPVLNGLAITNQDGAPKQAVKVIENAFQYASQRH